MNGGRTTKIYAMRTSILLGTNIYMTYDALFRALAHKERAEEQNISKIDHKHKRAPLIWSGPEATPVASQSEFSADAAMTDDAFLCLECEW